MEGREEGTSGREGAEEGREGEGEGGAGRRVRTTRQGRRQERPEERVEGSGEGRLTGEERQLGQTHWWRRGRALKSWTEREEQGR